MVFQSVTNLVILIYVNDRGWLLDNGYAGAEYWAARFRDFCIWATVIITIASGLLYVQTATAFYRNSTEK